VRSSDGLLARGAGYAVDGGSGAVRRLQRALRNDAYAPGPVDGIYGPLTEGAVRRFQEAHGLPIDGIVGPQTRAALRSAGLEGRRGSPAVGPGDGYRSPAGSARVIDVQRMLSAAGYETGAVDGRFGPQTEAAVQWFQVKRGLPPTGIVDRTTLRRLRVQSLDSLRTDGGAAPAELSAPPLPTAGWHGRPIRNPHRHGIAAAPAAAERGAADARSLRLGAGYQSAVGSRPVRRLQRRLLRLGYRPGPVDGIFGPQTKAAVQWFQMKHGLRPSGATDAATSAHMRALSVGNGRTQGGPERASGLVPRSRTSGPPRATQPIRPAVHTNDGGVDVSPLVVLVIGAFSAAAITSVMLRRRRLGTAERVPAADPTPPPAPVPVSSTNSHAGAADAPSAAPAPFSAAPQLPSRVVGYASAQDQAELDRQAAAIKRACRERGWTLACVIRENGSANGTGCKRPGLAHAFKQVRRGLAGSVVVDSLDHLGQSEDETRAQLQSLGAADTDLVALHAGGNGTPRRRPRRRAPA
jgi:peptidoglycan hydrolase-like protein with peptidoglycan-binding domain